MPSDHPVRPSFIGNCVKISIYMGLERKRVPRRIEQHKIQRQVEARLIVAIEVTDAVSLALDFAGEHAILELVDTLPHIFRIAHAFGTIVREDALEPLRWRGILVSLRVRGVIAQRFVLSQDCAGIDAKAIDTSPHPESQHISHRGPDGRIPPVEIGLFDEERVIVILFSRLTPLPGTASESAKPIVGGATVRGGVGPYIPVMSVIGSGRTALDEPR